jgi:hypothetical protein
MIGIDTVSLLEDPVGGTPPARRAKHNRIRAAVALGVSVVLSSAMAATASAAAVKTLNTKTDAKSSESSWLGTAPPPANPAHPGSPETQPDTTKPPNQVDPQAALHQAMLAAVAKAKASKSPVPVDNMTDAYTQTEPLQS